MSFLILDFGTYRQPRCPILSGGLNPTKTRKGQPPLPIWQSFLSFFFLMALQGGSGSPVGQDASSGLTETTTKSTAWTLALLEYRTLNIHIDK
ncbi:hypothetical protein WG66_000521 [Moniliophthora roreri]|nr:hypothetical protein WG66_000521 [Moniliophthora roreri]